MIYSSFEYIRFNENKSLFLRETYGYMMYRMKDTCLNKLYPSYDLHSRYREETNILNIFDSAHWPPPRIFFPNLPNHRNQFIKM